MYNIELFKILPIYKKIFDIDENKREINIYKLEKCHACGVNLYYPNILLKNSKKLILPLLEKTMSLQSSTIYEEYDMKFNYVSNNIITKYNKPLFYFIYNTDNYYHFLYDTLPYLISFLELKKEIPDLKLLMQYPNFEKKSFYPFVLEFLELLNIKNEDIIIINSNTEYDTIYISTSYTHDIDSNLPPRKEIYSFYKNFVNIVKKENNIINIPKKIYISRRTWIHNDFNNIGTNYTTRRKLVNEDSLVEYLLSNGYTEIFTEKLSTIEKILYFSNATHIIGSIGGGISNVLFSPSTTKLEVIVSPTFLEVNNRFKYSLEVVNVYYNYDTEHIEKDKYKTYMRVRTNNNKIIGEIEKICNDKLIVLYSENNPITGWNSQNIYKKIELNMNEVKLLDNGLNSPYIIKDIRNIKNI